MYVACLPPAAPVPMPIAVVSSYRCDWSRDRRNVVGADAPNVKGSCWFGLISFGVVRRNQRGCTTKKCFALSWVKIGGDGVSGRDGGWGGRMGRAESLTRTGGRAGALAAAWGADSTRRHRGGGRLTESPKRSHRAG
eukprot:gene4759-biopygen11538